MDLSRLHQSIKEQGGMQTVMDKKKWSKVADMVKIPKQVSLKKLFLSFWRHFMDEDYGEAGVFLTY